VSVSEAGPALREIVYYAQDCLATPLCDHSREHCADTRPKKSSPRALAGPMSPRGVPRWSGGPRGAILVEEEVAELLRELKALEDQGLGLAEALGALTSGEGSPTEGQDGATVAQGAPRTAEVAWDELRRDLLIWRTWAIAATLGLVVALTLWGLR